MKQTLWCATLALTACTTVESMTLGSLPFEPARDGAVVHDAAAEEEEAEEEQEEHAKTASDAPIVDARVVDAAVDAAVDAGTVKSTDAAAVSRDAKADARFPWEDEDEPPFKWPP